MPTNDRAELKKIRTIRSLIPYLRDEMGWPIGGEDLEELTFEYTADELGIDAANAAKIKTIQRLRPLKNDQPWGIFFITFEPKRLPVVALRRILGQVALKKRASANNSERAAWSTDDLLFISNYGEGDDREISFAHFSQPEGRSDLPTLKVLGWDSLDTPLHLDSVAKALRADLAWPTVDVTVDEWRHTWSSAFTLKHKEVITTSRDLSIRLAQLARSIRQRILVILELENDKGPMSKLMDAFRQALVHDLDDDGFADMYAQTIAYGLLSARIAAPTTGTADDLSLSMPVTNPFLKELMETFLHVGGRKGQAGGPGIDFDELGVSEVVDLLDHANMEAVIRDFGDKNPEEDPVIHFYELFLKEYDAKKRMQRGVFYTPRPVVSFIVRSVDELLRSDFGLEDGLADTSTWRTVKKSNPGVTIPEGVDPGHPFVQILDPATGTGTFLVEAIDVVHRTMTKKWEKQNKSSKEILELWNEYVPYHLLPRLHGFELMMAPYAIAHMKIGLKLLETGYRFGSDERVRVFLTNSLEAARSSRAQLALTLPALAHEAQEVDAVKRDARFTVVVGNPPYSLLSANLGDDQRAIIDPYRFVDGQRIKERGALQFEKNLQDDYVKFTRLTEVAVLASGTGISALVTNHAFIDNTTFRGLRSSLLKTYDAMWLLDLHGNAKKGLALLNGDRDQNVFDIQQGVAVTLGIRSPTKSPQVRRFKKDLVGLRAAKYKVLLKATVDSPDWYAIFPKPVQFLFLADESHSTEYDTGVSVDEIFPFKSAGIITARDGLVIDTNRHRLAKRIEAFRDSRLSDDGVLETFGVSKKKGWDVSKARKQLRAVKDVNDLIRPITYRPFDKRWIFYHSSLVWGQARPVFENMLSGGNVALMATRKVEAGEFAHAMVVDGLAECHSVSMKEVNYVMPLYRLAEGGLGGERDVGIPNLDPLAVKRLLGSEGATSSPEEILGLVYAILHSRGYRARYAASLRRDFPKIPPTFSVRLREHLWRAGQELILLHTGHTPMRAENSSSTTSWFGESSVQVTPGYPKFEAGRIHISANTYLEDIEEQDWNFRVGNYRVCEKWLKDRRGAVLTADDLASYKAVVDTVVASRLIIDDIDGEIERHGGWPRAFAR